VLQHSFDGSLAAAAHAYPQSRYRRCFSGAAKRRGLPCDRQRPATSGPTSHRYFIPRPARIISAESARRRALPGNPARQQTPAARARRSPAPGREAAFPHTASPCACGAAPPPSCPLPLAGPTPAARQGNQSCVVDLDFGTRWWCSPSAVVSAGASGPTPGFGNACGVEIGASV